MDQFKEPPRRGTQPLKAPKGSGDAFVSTTGQTAGPGQRGTRPLQPPPVASLKIIVPQKLDEARKTLNYVRHLVTLFGPPITVLRYAVYLTEPPPPPDEPAPPAVPAPLSDWASAPELKAEQPVESTEDAPAEPWLVIPEPFQSLSSQEQELAQRAAEVIALDPKIKQQAQVTLFQFDEAARSLEVTSALLDEVYSCSYEEAWDRLGEIGIERLKGKAYPICGFHENFKGVPVINRMFPAPHPQSKPATSPLGGAQTGPLVSPVVRPVEAPSSGTGSLLGKLKGLFGKP